MNITRPIKIVLALILLTGLAPQFCRCFGQANINELAPATNAPPTISGAFQEALAAIKDNTNLLWETHAIYAPGLSQRWGAGIGVAYQISPYVFASTRLELLDRSLVLPVGNLGLQLPVNLGSWFHATPFVYAGIGFPLSGMTVGGVTVPGQARSLDPIAIVGAGAALRVWTGTKSYVDLIGDYEKWQGVSGNEIRAGVAIHF